VDTPDLLRHERRLMAHGARAIAGVDEAGRGALFGPVVAAAVILDLDGTDWSGVRDSKTLSEAARERLYPHILEYCRAWAVGESSSSEIDRINILKATHRAMALAVDGLEIAPCWVLVDGNSVPRLQYPCEALIRGDASSVSVASASIVAKVWRDRRIRELSREYPGYGLDRNKGYGTREHLSAIRGLGPTAHHRMTFRGVAAPGKEGSSRSLQIGLFDSRAGSTPHQG